MFKINNLSSEVMKLYDSEGRIVAAGQFLLPHNKE
jgi:hypothetical protein